MVALEEQTAEHGGYGEILSVGQMDTGWGRFGCHCGAQEQCEATMSGRQKYTGRPVCLYRVPRATSKVGSGYMA